LHATFEALEAPLIEPANGFLGIDMGIVDIATTSTGIMACGAQLTRYRKRQIRLRKRLQAKKISSARRLLNNGAAQRHALPPTSTTRSRNASWPRLNAPDAALPSKTDGNP